MCWAEPDTRDKGIAKALLLEIEKWFKEKGIIYVDLNFITGNREAEQTWDRLGFKP